VPAYRLVLRTPRRDLGEEISAQMVLDVIGEHAQENVGAHPLALAKWRR
jgi:hypothetical protein